MPAKTAQVDLDDSAVLRLMQDPNVTAQFPFLASAMARSTNQAKNCGRCSKRHRQPPQVDYNLIRRQLAELPVKQKLQLKALLHTEQIVVRYQNANGQRVKLVMK